MDVISYKIARDAAIKADNLESLVNSINTSEGVSRAISYYIDGTLKTEANAMSFIAPTGLVIQEVRLLVDTAPTDADLIIDVNINGTTAYTTQANRPTISDGVVTGISVTPDITAIALGDKVSIDLDQVGSTLAGENLSVSIICEEA